MRGALTYAAFRVGLALAPRVPGPVLDRLAAWAGELVYQVAAGPRRAVLANLRPALETARGMPPDRGTLARTARGVFRQSAYNYVSLLRLPALDAATIRRRVPVEGWSELERGLQAGRGVILVSAHLGDFSLGMQVLAARGQGVIAPVEVIRPPALFRLVRQLRASQGLTVLPLGPSALRAMLRALRANGVIALLADRDLSGHGLPVPFMGRLVRLPTGPIDLALRTGAAVLPAFCWREPSGRTPIRAGPLLDWPRTGDAAQDRLAGVTALARRLEAAIVAHPDQWVVFEAVWRPELGQNAGSGRRWPEA